MLPNKFNFFFFIISGLKGSWILKILVPTPHNTHINMWGTDKNFFGPRSFEHRKRKNKISKKYFFLVLTSCIRAQWYIWQKPRYLLRIALLPLMVRKGNLAIIKRILYYSTSSPAWSSSIMWRLGTPYCFVELNWTWMNHW